MGKETSKNWLPYILYAAFASTLIGLMGPEEVLMQMKAVWEKPGSTLSPLPCTVGKCGGTLLTCLLDEACRKTVGKSHHIYATIMNS